MTVKFQIVENSSFVLSSITIPVSGVNSNNGQRSNHHIPSSSTRDGQNYMVVPQTSHQSHQLFLHGSSLGSSSQLPPNYAQQEISYHNVPPTSSDSIAVQTYNRGVGYKRKHTAMSMVFDEGGTSEYYSGGGSLGLNNYNGRSSSYPYNSSNGTSLVLNNYPGGSSQDLNNLTGGSSSNLPVPEDHLPVNYMPTPQSGPWNYWRNDVVPVAPSRSHRNVRSRYCYGPHQETNPAGPYPLTTASRNPYPPWFVSGDGLIGQSGQSIVAMSPGRRVFSAGTNIIHGATEANARYQSYPTQTRNPSSLVPAWYAPSTGVIREGNNNYHRVSSYRDSRSYLGTGFVATTLEERGQSGIEATTPSQYVRPPLRPSLPIVGHHNGINSRRNERSNWSRDYYLEQWVSQGIIMGHFDDDWDFLDLHRDMRLGIDSMSYEELLALEESIGNVSTGLSENKLSNCLKVRKYCSSDQILDDKLGRSCAICLEECEDQENLGRLHCRHEFHLKCIKTWLQMKDVCPIYKAFVMNADSKEKGEVSL
ncbi:hypothetical protein J5N97_013705 [Dioscorea zingiberensis]|uniref:RING-type E3 ubiquitin transferase n=1 Tax=Dioscorea zingiberensis TaxID=325984 RepID=A0A9D5CR18_9LILI|nr:hypothetical protein J5N97_013705 [Dioscorea zingiberensis]